LDNDGIQAGDLSSQWILFTTRSPTVVRNLPGKLKELEQISGSLLERHREAVENAGSQSENHSLEVFCGHAALEVGLIKC